MNHTPSLPSRRDALRLFGLTSAATLAFPSFLRAESTGNSKAPSANKSGQNPGYYRFKIGSIDAWALNDGGFSAQLEQAPFGVGEPRTQLATVLDGHFLDNSAVNLTFNVLLLKIGSELLLIDAGCGAAFGAAGGNLVANLAAAGFAPEQITGIIITHLHGDHVGGLLSADGQPIFTRAKLFLHRDEPTFWNAGDLSGPAGEFVALAQKYLRAFDGKWQLIKAGDKLVEGLEILEASGHTPGHIAFNITSGNDALLHWVDVAHHHVLSLAHPEWKLAWDAMPDLAISTRKRFLDRAATDRARVFGAHMPFPALGHVRRAGSSFEYVIEPWSFA